MKATATIGINAQDMDGDDEESDDEEKQDDKDLTCNVNSLVWNTMKGEKTLTVR